MNLKIINVAFDVFSDRHKPKSLYLLYSTSRWQKETGTILTIIKVDMERQIEKSGAIIKMGYC